MLLNHPIDVESIRYIPNVTCGTRQVNIYPARPFMQHIYTFIYNKRTSVKCHTIENLFVLTVFREDLIHTVEVTILNTSYRKKWQKEKRAQEIMPQRA